MYPPSTIKRIEALLAAGVFQRRIAEQLGVSRGLVQRVLRGDKSKRQRVELQGPFIPIEATRCGSCGALVLEAPCRRCYLVAVANVTPRSLPEPAPVPVEELLPDPHAEPLPEDLPELDSNAEVYLASPAFLERNTGPIIRKTCHRDPSPEQIRRRAEAIRKTWTDVRLCRQNLN